MDHEMIKNTAAALFSEVAGNTLSEQQDVPERLLRRQHIQHF